MLYYSCRTRIEKTVLRKKPGTAKSSICSVIIHSDYRHTDKNIHQYTVAARYMTLIEILPEVLGLFSVASHFHGGMKW